MPFIPYKRRTAPDGSLVALADCDSFYASCETVARPDLEGKPVAVLSNNDGCIVAMNRAAKKLGIPMGEPYFKARTLLERHGVEVFSSNYTLYGSLSARIMEILKSVAPRVEQYSIDESFLHFHAAQAPCAADMALEARRRVTQWVGVPLSIGIAPTKVLAKIAAKLAKKEGGIYDLSMHRRLEPLLDKIPVDGLWGVGRKGAIKLKTRGIYTALHLREADPALVRKLLTVSGLNIWTELHGVPAIREEIPLTHHTIVSSRSLGFKVRDLARLEEAVAYHAGIAAAKLRRKGLMARIVGVRLQTAHYDDKSPRHDEAMTVVLSRHTEDTVILAKAARHVLSRLFRQGHGYAKVMVMLGDLLSKAEFRPDLLHCIPEIAERDAKSAKLMAVMDTINARQGRDAVHLAAQGGPRRDWHMNRNMLSPCWTTDWNDLIRVGPS